MRQKIKSKILQCTRCGYEWICRKLPIGKLPKNCARSKCNSPYWNKKKVRFFSKTPAVKI